MRHESEQAVVVFPRFCQARVQAHAVLEHENVSEQDGQRMAHKEVLKARAARRIQVLLCGHDRIRPYMRAAKFRVVIVMVIVRAPPNTARAQYQDPEDPHQHPGETGMRQYRLMLLVVINDEESK